MKYFKQTKDSTVHTQIVTKGEKVGKLRLNHAWWYEVGDHYRTALNEYRERARSFWKRVA